MTEVSTKIGASKKTPIVTLETNFKSLRYKDYSNGKEPLVTKDINKYSSTKNQHGWYRQYAQGTLSEVTNRADDITRITKWVATPRGVLWEVRQAALESLQTELVAKRRDVEQPENNKSFVGKILKKVGRTLVTSAELTASTLAQVAASETGYRTETFLARSYLGARDRNSVLSEILNTFKVSRDSQFSGAQQVLGGQDVEVNNTNWDVDTSFSLRNRIKNGSNYDLEARLANVPKLVSDPEVSPKGRLVFSDSGFIDNKWKEESGSYLGNDDKKILVDHSGSKYRFDATASIGKYASSSTINEKGRLTYGQGKVLENSWKESNSYYLAYDKARKRENLNTKFGVLEEKTEYGPGKSETPSSVAGGYYTPVNTSGSGKYYTSVKKVERALGNSKHLGSRKTAAKATGVNGSGENLIPFVFATYATNDPIYFEFEATLESLSDSFTGNWNGTQYIGRPEQFFVYQGFTRSISFSFVAVAKAPEELQPLYRKLNRLASTTAPVYGDNTNEYFMQGVIGEVTIGDYLQHQKGYFGSIKLDWKTDYMWDIDGTGGIIVPMALDVSVDFTPIHEFNVMYQDTGYFGFKYVAPPTEEAESKETTEGKVTTGVAVNQGASVGVGTEIPENVPYTGEIEGVPGKRVDREYIDRLLGR